MGWQDDLPEVLRDAPFIGKAESVEDALQQITNAAGHMGNSIRTPGPDAGEEAVAEHRNKVIERFPDLMLKPSPADEENYNAVLSQLGMPEEAGKYAAPEGMEIDGDKLGKLANMAHKSRLTQKQFQAFLSELTGEDAAVLEATADAHKQDMDRLRQEWGAAFEQKSADAMQSAKDTSAPDYMIEAIESGTMPAVGLKWLAGINDQLGGESGDVNNQGKGNREPVMTPAEAEEQISELLTRIHNNKTPPAERKRLQTRLTETLLFAKPELRGKKVGGGMAAG